METAIEVHGLRVDRGDREVLHQVSARIPRGEITGLLDPSGSGKSVMSDVGLTDQANQLIQTLSGGQRSRASLACALVSQPDVLVLDEPTIGQDPLLRDELWRRFRALADAGTTLVVSSHVMDEANRCDRLLLIRDGSFIADDTPRAIKTAADTEDLDEAFLLLVRAQADDTGREVDA